MAVEDSGGGSDALVAALYDELRRSAHREFGRAGSPQTWQTTAVIHEAWLKLHTRDDWDSREHFIRTASTAMRHIMIDAARARLAERRGGGQAVLPIEAAEGSSGEGEDLELARLGDAL